MDTAHASGDIMGRCAHHSGVGSVGDQALRPTSLCQMSVFTCSALTSYKSFFIFKLMFIYGSCIKQSAFVQMLKEVIDIIKILP